MIKTYRLFFFIGSSDVPNPVPTIQTTKTTNKQT